MRYDIDGMKMYMSPCEFNKDSGKEILQYAVGGLLYMPAINIKIADKIISGEMRDVKSFVLDLEDSLGDDMIKYGKRNIRDIIIKFREAIEDGRLNKSELPLIFI